LGLVGWLWLADPGPSLWTSSALAQEVVKSSDLF